MSDQDPSEESLPDSGVRAGQVIGDRYEVIRRLGSGGMGFVFEVKHRALDQNFALKMLKPALATDPQLAARFLQEAKSASALRHRNIVQVTDFGVHEGRPFMVMELLKGETLAALMT